MSNKTYNQFCAIACALDLIGDRWTLLIVRNLLLGPKRFSDLMHGLPGISTNILTDRLKGLETNALITTRTLPPPAPATVYELTADGLALTDSLSALARWGMSRLPDPDSSVNRVTEGIGFMVMGLFYRESLFTEALRCNVRVTGVEYAETFGVALDAAGFSFSERALPDADVTLAVSLSVLPALSSASESLQRMLDRQQVTMTGDPHKRARLIAWMDGARAPAG